MASTENNQTDANKALIDIFYRDIDRIKSLMSQILHGTIEEITETSENANEETVTRKGNLGLTRALGSEFTGADTESVKRILQHKKAPYDELALRLLSMLSLNPKTQAPSTAASQLDIYQGVIVLRHYKVLADVLPLVQKCPEMLSPQLQLLAESKNLLRQLQSKKKKSAEDVSALAQLKQDVSKAEAAAQPMLKSFELFSNVKAFFPKGIGYELKMPSGEIFTGELKPEHLMDSEEIIFNNYGEKLPAQWNILGIMDRALPADGTDKKDPFGALSVFSREVHRTIFNRSSKGTIIPILIYRELIISDEH